MLLTLQGPGNFGKLALMSRAPGGFTILYLSDPTQGFGLQACQGFFLSFSLSLKSGLAHLESSSLFPSSPRAHRGGWKVPEPAKSRAKKSFVLRGQIISVLRSASQEKGQGPPCLLSPFPHASGEEAGCSPSAVPAALPHGSWDRITQSTRHGLPGPASLPQAWVSRGDSAKRCGMKKGSEWTLPLSWLLDSLA